MKGQGKSVRICAEGEGKRKNEKEGQKDEEREMGKDTLLPFTPLPTKRNNGHEQDMKQEKGAPKP